MNVTSRSLDSALGSDMECYKSHQRREKKNKERKRGEERREAVNKKGEGRVGGRKGVDCRPF